ncbi:MAG: AAA family ATPase [bacterium]|nr:AAA family ATPase [bacterium]
MKEPYKNIVVAGDVGAGTTTLAKALAKELGWEFESAGSFFRDYAIKNSIPLWDKESVPDEVDKKVDAEMTERLKTGEHLVLDTHYAGWFTRDEPSVFKILLLCDRQIATERMLKRKHTHEETPETIEKRRQGLYAKFKKLYSDEPYEDPKFYDLVIDTGKNSPAETLAITLKNFHYVKKDW